MRGTVAVALLMAGLVAGHGSMTFPTPRNQHKTHYCPHCANGPDVCGSGSGGQWPATSEASYWSSSYAPSPVRLTAGGTVDVEYYITAAHLGHFVVEICYYDGSSSTISDSCFQRLERDPSTTKFSPYNPKKPTIAYFPENSCAGSYASASRTMMTRFKVPAGRTADKAILRWYWQTGNSCLNDDAVAGNNVDSSLSGWRLDNCKVATSNGGLCGSNCPSSNCAGEQFKNCADVVVVSNGPSNVNKDNATTGGSNGGGNDNTTTTTRRTTTTTRRTTSTTRGKTTTTTRRPGTTSTTRGKTTTTTRFRTSTTRPSNNGGGSVVSACKKEIEGRQDYFDVTCREQCQVFLDTHVEYCTGKGYRMDGPGLADCIVSVFPNLCERD